MALAGLPPWLDITPETFGSAMRAGASAGTALRGQDIERANAGDRLRLAYAQLQSQEERASEQAAAKLELAHAQLSARQEQESLMNQFRMQTLKQESDRASELADYRDRSLEARGASLAQRTEAANAMNDIREKRASDLNDYRGELQDNRAKLYDLGQQNLNLRKAALTRPRLTESDKALMGADVSDLKGIEKKLDTTEPVGFGPLHPFGGNLSEIANLKKQASALRAKIGNYEPQRLSLGGTTEEGDAAAPIGDTAGASPFREGALIRSKKDGKLYRVKNGEPVPEDQ